MLTHEFVRKLYDRPLFELLDEARTVHRAHHPDQEVQLCTLLSVKTGGCPEDCAYCPQSSHYETERRSGEDARRRRGPRGGAARAKDGGSTRFCMGAAWREVKDGPAFDRVLAMVRGVKDLGLEACVTLGMLTEAQARKLKDAGLDAYNHNLDTSRAALPVDHLDAHLRRPASTRSRTCARRASRSARAASSAWARASTTAARCFARWRTSIRSPRASRSTRSSRWKGRRSGTCRRSIRSTSCA